MNRMRYAIVSDVEARGGAGIATARLAAALVERGHDVHWVSPRPDGRAHAWRTAPFRLGTSRRALQYVARRAGVAWRLHDVLVTQPLRQILARLVPDVVNLHNLHGARWQAGVLDAVPATARLMWTLHDMWTLTGRCAYAYDCRSYMRGCDAACPTPGEYPALDPARIADAWTERVDALARRPDAIAIAPSRWLAREAKAGLWHRHAVAHVPNGVPANLLAPVPRADARAALGLPLQEPVILVMSEKLGERRKGWSYLHEALEHWQGPAVRVLLVGHGGAQLALPSPHRAMALGRVDDGPQQRVVLSAADLLVHPAPVDNLPNVVLEAMACGLPTVAFAVGGLPDMVRPGLSGWLAPEVSAEALRTTLAGALATLPVPGLSATCRELAVTEYAPGLQAQRYEALAAGGRDDLVNANAG